MFETMVDYISPSHDQAQECQVFTVLVIYKIDFLLSEEVKCSKPLSPIYGNWLFRSDAFVVSVYTLFNEKKYIYTAHIDIYGKGEMNYSIQHTDLNYIHCLSVSLTLHSVIHSLYEH